MTDLDLFRSASPPPRASNRRRYASPLLVCVLTALMALLSGCSSSEEAPTLEGAPTPTTPGPFSYVCENGTASSRNDAASEGMNRCVSCDPLYGLDGAADTIGATCSYSVEIGEAVRIGSATEFGVVEELFPSGLAAIGNTLYMVETTTAALYTLDTNTGVATRVGSATEFGEEEEGLPNGLAAIGNTLYMVGGSKDALYKLDTNTGVATRVGSAKGFGVVSADDENGEHHPTGLAAIDGTLYMLGEVTAALYTLDTNTGVAKRVGSEDEFGLVSEDDEDGEDSPSGLAAIGNILYMVGGEEDALYRLDTTTGEATRVGSANTFGVDEYTPNGLAIIGNTLYMVGAQTDALHALRYPNVACTGNQVPNSDNTLCIPCLGNMVSNSDNTMCMPCTGNQTPNSDGTACIACTDNLVPNFDNTRCIRCPGNLLPNSDNTMCMPCLGNTVPDPDNTMCMPCTGNQVLNDDRTACMGCRGNQMPNSDRTACITCTGDYVINAARTGCTKCVGRTLANDDHTRCISCPDNQVPNDEKTGCMTCNEGRQVANAARTGCTECQGTRVPNADRTACIICGENGGNTGYNADFTACIRCRGGRVPTPVGRCAYCIFITPDTGTVANPDNSACVRCTGNTVPNADSTQCTPCPEGLIAKYNNRTCDIDDSMRNAPYPAANAGCDTNVTFSNITTIMGGYGCTGCHDATGSAGAGYSLTSRANALGNGSDSNPNVVANNPWASLLFVKVWGQSATFPTTMPARGSNAVDFIGGKMPLGCSGNRCIDTNQGHVNAFFCWIRQGAN